MAQPQLPTGVHVLERGWLSANNIVFTDGVTAIVDTGYWSHQAQTVALVESLLGDADLELLLNTHLHSDHCGGNSALVSRYSGARTLIPSGQSNHVLQWNPEALTYTPTGQYCPPFSFQGVLQNGDQV